MCSVDPTTREYDGQVVVVLRGELDVPDTVRGMAELPIVAARERDIIDLAGLSSSTPAAWRRWYEYASTPDTRSNPASIQNNLSPPSKTAAPSC